MSSPEQPEKPQPAVFVRESTGLVKSVGFFDSIAMNMSNMSVGALLGVIGISGLVPMAVFTGHSIVGVNLILLSVIAFVVSIPQIVVYTIMSRRYPRTGGDYVWVSRVFGGPAGSILSFMGYTLETTAYLALIVLSTVFAIGTVGYFFYAPATFSASNFWLGLLVPAQNPTNQFLVGALVFAVLIAINILRPKAGFKVVSILTIFSIFAILLAIGTLLSAGRSGVEAAIASPQFNATSYQTIANQYPGGFFNLGNTVFLLPLLAAFVYPWLNASPAVASEIKGKTALKWNVPISAVFVFILLTAAIATMYYVAGQAFTNAAYSNYNLVYDLSFNFWTLAMGASGNSIVAGLIGLGWIVSNITVLAYGIIVISRYLLAQSFDRFLPARISNVSSRFGSPILAHVVDLAVTLGLVGIAAFYYNGVMGLFGAILASMVYFMFVGLAASVHAFRKESGAIKLVLGVCGILDVLVFGFLSYQFLANQSMWSLNSLTYGFIAASVVAGALIYFGSKWYNMRRGIDISLAYKELPPE